MRPPLRRWGAPVACTSSCRTGRVPVVLLGEPPTGRHDDAVLRPRIIRSDAFLVERDFSALIRLNNQAFRRIELLPSWLRAVLLDTFDLIEIEDRERTRNDTAILVFTAFLLVAFLDNVPHTMCRLRAPTDSAEWLALRIGKVRTAFTALVLNYRDTARLACFARSSWA